MGDANGAGVCHSGTQLAAVCNALKGLPDMSC